MRAAFTNSVSQLKSPPHGHKSVYKCDYTTKNHHINYTGINSSLLYTKTSLWCYSIAWLESERRKHAPFAHWLPLSQSPTAHRCETQSHIVNTWPLWRSRAEERRWVSHWTRLDEPTQTELENEWKQGVENTSFQPLTAGAGLNFSKCCKVFGIRT